MAQNAEPSETAPVGGAAWVARLISGDATADDHLACMRWRSLSAMNEVDYQRARTAWNASSAARNSLQEKNPGWRTIGGMAASVAITLVAALLVLGPDAQNVSPQEQSYAANSVQMTEVTLRYGAEIALNMGSEISVIEAREKTSVRLSKGEVFFAVEPGQERSFVVQAGNVLVTVTGTAFEVARFPTNTIITVEHGEVRVAVGESPSRSLRAGDRVVISTNGAMTPLANIPPGIVAAWREEQLIFVDEPLGLVFERLQLYSQGRIRLTPDVDAALLVSATFANQDIDSVLSGLDETLPISIERTASGDFVVSQDGAGK